MKKQTLRIAASAATVGVMSIVGFGMVAHAEPNPIKAVGQSFNGMFHRHGGHGPMQNLSSVATALNMSEADVRTQLDAGKSLADIAAAQNVSVQSVIDAVVADMKAHVATEVASGEITQTEADAKLADVVARATDMVNGVRPAGMPEGMAGGMGGRGPSPESITAIAKVLNLTETQLQTEVQSGKSLADVAAAQNVSVQSVIDAVVSQMKAHIASEVASGEITQAQADTKLADVTAHATDMVNGVRPAGMPGDKVGGMGGGKGAPGHRGHGDDGDDDGEGHDDGGAEDGDA